MDNYNYNYPEGSDTPDAPWNDTKTPSREFSSCCVQTLSKITTVYTDDYIEGEVYKEAEYEDGQVHTTITQDPPDTSNTNWQEAYINDHMTPLDLINTLKEIKSLEIKTLQAQIESYTTKKDKYITQYLALLDRLKEAKYICQECDGWVSDDLDITGGL